MSDLPVSVGEFLGWLGLLMFVVLAVLGLVALWAPSGVESDE